MGHIVLQMMISVDGLVSGPKGELDWITNDTQLEQAHTAALEQADATVIGIGAYREMSGYWKAAEHDENEKDVMRTLARTFNNKRKIVYSHEDMTVDWQNTEVHVVTDDQALAKDIQRLKQEVDGTIIVYGGVRLARSLVRQDLVDEFNFDVCPVILGEGQPLFSQLTHRTKLRVRHVATYDSGTTSISYEVVR